VDGYFKMTKVFKPIASKFPTIKTQEQYYNFQKRFISKVVTNTGADTLMYTVPDDFVFVLLSATVSYTGNNASGLGDGQIYTNNGSLPDVVWTAGLGAIPAGQIISVNHIKEFGAGVVFPARTTFKAVNGSNPRSVSLIIGYEVQKQAYELGLVP